MFADETVACPGAVFGEAVSCLYAKTSVSADPSLLVRNSVGFVSSSSLRSPFALVVGSIARENKSLDLKPSSGISLKHLKWVIKKKPNQILLVVGVDVPLNNIVLTNDCTLMGCFSGRRTNEMGVNSWAKCTWLEYVEAVPVVYVFPRGWLAFKFQHSLNPTNIIIGSWKWDGDALFLKR